MRSVHLLSELIVVESIYMHSIDSASTNPCEIVLIGQIVSSYCSCWVRLTSDRGSSVILIDGTGRGGTLS